MTALVARDLVSPSLRKWWRDAGFCPGLDLFTLFTEHARAHPDRTAVIDDDGELDYDTLLANATRLAGAFQQAGVLPGEVVAVQLPNGRDAVTVDLAAAAIGAVVLAYPVGRGRRDTVTLLGRSRAAAAVVMAKFGDHTYAETLEQVRDQLPDLRTVVVSGGGPDNLQEWIAQGSSLSRPHPVDPGSPARILVSSGSEAAPKMIVYSHDALAGGRGAFIRRLHDHDTPMRNLFLVPLASSFGSSGTAVTLCRFGGTLIVQSRFDAGHSLELIGSAKPHLVFGVPTMYTLMLDHPGLAATDMSSLRGIVGGGSRVDPTTVAACRTAFGCAFVNCYGSADGVNSTTDLTDQPETAHTAVGRPNPAVAAIRIVEDGRDVPCGEVGEILGLGPMSPLCYVDDDFNARYRTDDGWVRSGDLGRLDENGYLHVVGRRSEIVIRGGRNLSPVEVELLIGQHPAVRQVACVGFPDWIMGERMAACLSIRGGASAPTLDELTNYLTDEHGLEQAKLPELLVILELLPLNAAGKIDKRWLRDRVTRPTG